MLTIIALIIYYNNSQRLGRIEISFKPDGFCLSNFLKEGTKRTLSLFFPLSLVMSYMTIEIDMYSSSLHPHFIISTLRLKAQGQWATIIVKGHLVKQNMVHPLSCMHNAAEQAQGFSLLSVCIARRPTHSGLFWNEIKMN